MVDESIVEIIKRYLDVLRENGINAEKAVLFGSYARGESGKYSDIDILVIAEEFDRDRWSNEDELFKLTRKADTRIQPIPVGARQFLEDNESVVIEMARREGIEIRKS